MKPLLVLRRKSYGDRESPIRPTGCFPQCALVSAGTSKNRSRPEHEEADLGTRNRNARKEGMMQEISAAAIAEDGTILASHCAFGAKDYADAIATILVVDTTAAAAQA